MNMRAMKITEDAMSLTLAELDAMPTLAVGQADDLKIEIEDGTPSEPTMRARVWLSRCGIEDGEPFANTGTVEISGPFNGWTWETYHRFEVK